MEASMIYALVLFTIMSTLGLIMSIVITLNPAFGIKFTSSPAGIDQTALAARDQDAARALKFQLGFGASQLFCLNFLSLFIVWFAFRTQQQWAWIAMCFYPLMFVWHYLHYDKKSPAIKIQVMWFVLSVAALILTYPIFFK